MLIDPQQRDSDLTNAAATTIEASLPRRRPPQRPSAFLRSAIADPTMDANNRVAAMKALVAIGAKVANQTAANEAFPELTTAVDSDDVVDPPRSLPDARPTRPSWHRRAIPRCHQRLETAMRDEDMEVRLNASEAILSITPPL